MKHSITARDDGFRDAVIVWDDETGAVEGDHSRAPRLAAAIADGPMTVRFPHPPGSFDLADPAHDASDFLTALRSVLLWPLHVELPAELADVVPTPYPPLPAVPEGAAGVDY